MAGPPLPLGVVVGLKPRTRGPGEGEGLSRLAVSWSARTLLFDMADAAWRLGRIGRGVN